jgi:hypothetical protein
MLARIAENASLPYTVHRSARRRLAPFRWLTRGAGGWVLTF